MATRESRASGPEERRARRLSDVVSSSDIVKRSLRSLETANLLIRAEIYRISDLQQGGIDAMFLVSMRNWIDESTSMDLATVAAVEVFTHSPLPMSRLMDLVTAEAPEASFQISQWAESNMSNSAYNFLLMVGDDLKMRENPDAKMLDEAVRLFGSRREVLRSISLNEEQRGIILQKEAERLLINPDPSVKTFADCRTMEDYATMLDLLRRTDRGSSGCPWGLPGTMRDS